jgi:hypothetical protein
LNDANLIFNCCTSNDNISFGQVQDDLSEVESNVVFSSSVVGDDFNLCIQVKDALLELARSSDLNTFRVSLHTLEDCTRHSRACCDELVSHDDKKAIYSIIHSCIPNTPELIDLMNISLIILNNVITNIDTNKAFVPEF